MSTFRELDEALGAANGEASYWRAAAKGFLRELDEVRQRIAELEALRVDAGVEAVNAIRERDEARRERDEARADAKQQDIWREQMAQKWREENIAHHKVLDKLDQALRELDEVRELGRLAAYERDRTLRERDEVRADRRHRLAAEDSLKARLEEEASLRRAAEDRALWAEREQDGAMKWQQEWAHADAQRIRAVRERDEARSVAQEIADACRSRNWTQLYRLREENPWLDKAMLNPAHEEEE